MYTKQKQTLNTYQYYYTKTTTTTKIIPILYTTTIAFIHTIKHTHFTSLVRIVFQVVKKQRQQHSVIDENAVVVQGRLL